jgi:hypothetical protein
MLTKNFDPVIVLASLMTWLVTGCTSVTSLAPSPTFYEIFPLPNTAVPSATSTAAPTLETTPPLQGGSGAPDLVAIVRTSLAPPQCYDAHSRAGALVSVTNVGPADAGPFMVEVDGVWQAVPGGLPAGQSIILWFDGSVYKLPWASMTVTVDAANQVVESDESNNVTTAFVATLTPPLSCPTATAVP